MTTPSEREQVVERVDTLIEAARDAETQIHFGNAAARSGSYDTLAAEREKTIALINAARSTMGEASGLYDALAHGDEDHRAWLREAIDAHFAGQPVPPPRGKGRKEAEIERLKAQLYTMGDDAVERVARAIAPCLERAHNEYQIARAAVSALKGQQ